MAAVDKIEDQRKLKDFIGHRDRDSFAFSPMAKIKVRLRRAVGKQQSTGLARDLSRLVFQKHNTTGICRW